MIKDDRGNQYTSDSSILQLVDTDMERPIILWLTKQPKSTLIEKPQIQKEMIRISQKTPPMRHKVQPTIEDSYLFNEEDTAKPSRFHDRIGRADKNFDNLARQFDS